MVDGGRIRCIAAVLAREAVVRRGARSRQDMSGGAGHLGRAVEDKGKGVIQGVEIVVEFLLKLNYAQCNIKAAARAAHTANTPPCKWANPFLWILSATAPWCTQVLCSSVLYSQLLCSPCITHPVDIPSRVNSRDTCRYVCIYMSMYCYISITCQIDAQLAPADPF